MAGLRSGGDGLLERREAYTVPRTKKNIVAAAEVALQRDGIDVGKLLASTLDLHHGRNHNCRLCSRLGTILPTNQSVSHPHSQALCKCEKLT